MATAVVVDDLKTDRRLAGALLENRTDLKVVYAANGREALARMEVDVPDLVLTDMLMPQMDGLELVEALRKDYPAVPVILMTAHGSEEAAAVALQKGATSYVPKKYLARDLAPTVERILKLAGIDREHQAVLAYLTETECRFVLDNDMSNAHPVIGYLRDQIRRMNILNESELTRVSVALDESLANAIYHGNLEVSGDMPRSEIALDQAQLDQRRQTPPFRDRRVYVTAKVSREQVAVSVRDEGKGLDPSKLPDPTNPANLETATGRGLLLIRSFMDEVRHNDAGNEITMIKRRTEILKEG